MNVTRDPVHIQKTFKDIVMLLVGDAITSLQLFGTGLGSAEIRSTAKENRTALHFKRTLEKTWGASLVMLLARQNLALFQALLSHGTSRETANDLVLKGNRRLLWPSFGALRLGKYFLGLSTLARLKRVNAWVNRFPFSAPGWEQQPVADGDDLAFDYIRCPVSELMTAESAADLCDQAFCSLDYDIAAVLNVELHRAETLAKGCTRCTFRWTEIGKGAPKKSLPVVP